LAKGGHVKVVLKDGKLEFEFDDKNAEGDVPIVEANVSDEVGEADAEEPVLA
jgi:hypothetical protein